MVSARYALINAPGGGFNPPDIAATHNTILDCKRNISITRDRPPASAAFDSQASANSAKNA
jgi:hypothetical protein